ncbi:hypothetical protein LAG90_02435 [Marinilongibacter aquaticus]|uniref:hypothetical protein n=1 Tax=Marinilongibacter aquaticus TaxID=2975157 RepID=UPI0021BD3AD2|nr:hypothetical protein [Marinilongibacter aquaticus]UBM59513.1 hypothetical protein LAG90_02435 [Marinilongibacter aquaticus]
MGLTNLGIFHTLIGLIAIIAALVSYFRFGKINLSRLSGKLYFYGTVVTSLTALGISKLGGFNPGHAFALFIVALVLLAYFLHAKKPGNNRFRFVENFALSFSFFLSWVPTVNETLTRVPLGHPIAKGPTDPSIAITLLVLFVLFLAGSVYQFRKQKSIYKSAAQEK